MLQEVNGGSSLEIPNIPWRPGICRWPIDSAWYMRRHGHGLTEFSPLVVTRMPLPRNLPGRYRLDPQTWTG
jgi:hypothetical protein